MKSVKLAYLLWITAGFFGAHRWYVGKWATAVAYFGVLMLVLAGGLVFELFLVLCLALVVDAFLIPGLVRKRNEALAEEFREHPERFVAADLEDVAPWARGRSRSGIAYRLGTPVRVLAFVLLPAVAGTMAVWLGTYELVIFPIVILLATGLVSSLDRIVVRYPTLSEIPGLDSALERVQEMRRYYWEHEPGVLRTFAGLFGKAFGAYRPYWKLVGAMILAVAVETVLTYRDNYPPYLGIADAVLEFLVLAAFVALTALVVLVPLTTLSFRYSLSGKRRRLRVLTVCGLAICGSVFLASYLFERSDGQPTVSSASLLESRMANPEFRKNLKTKLEAFLKYYATSETQSLSRSDLTKQLRESIAAVAVNDESEAFEFLSGKTFYAVAYKHGSGPCVPGSKGSDADIADGANADAADEGADADVADGARQAAGIASPFYFLSVVDRAGGNVYHRFADLPADVQAELAGTVGPGSPDGCRTLIDSFDQPK